MTPDIPKTEAEIDELLSNGDIEILDCGTRTDGSTWVAICDNRRTYEEGEIYEVTLNAPILKQEADDDD